jgi:hypothetical protein
MMGLDQEVLCAFPGSRASNLVKDIGDQPCQESQLPIHDIPVLACFDATYRGIA